ncbi:MAG TPA: flagellar biosynthetic protein FliO [Bryobacteraceae bacterium]|nr:flagellar biosynthetic protein FliO [Bryobacteraceae bacterium]
MVQQILAVILVLGLLAGALWLLRSRGLAHYHGLPGRKSPRQLESIARLPLTAHHSVHLVRVSDHAVLLALSPSGCTLVERLDRTAAAAPEIAQPCAGASQ